MHKKLSTNTKNRSSLFETERDLQQHFQTLDLNLPGQFGVTVYRREVPIGNCVPDFIFVRFKKLPRPDFLPKRCSFKHSYILWLLKKRKKLRPETIANWSYESLDRIRPLLNDLIRSETIKKLPSGSLTLSDEILEIEAEVVAVETKLYRWTEALKQAEDYLYFANRVFVAMDPEGLPRTNKALIRFRNTGIGLCEVRSNSLNWIIEPSVRKGKLGPEREYLIASSSAPSTQTLWNSR